MADETTGQPAQAAPETITTTTPVETKTEVVSHETIKPAATPAPSAIADINSDDPPVAAPADWPEDWREKAASHSVGKSDGPEYDKEFKRLQRLTSPAEMWKSYRNMEAKQAKAPPALTDFPADGTPEEQASWRKTRGVPERADEYIKDLSLPEGLKISDADKPIVDDYLALAHKSNMSAKEVKDNIQWYYAAQEKQREAIAKRDEEMKASVATELRAEMGVDYKKNLTAAYGLLESAPEGVLQAISESRAPDGSKLGNNPQVIRWLSSLALEVNPTATVTPGSGAGAIANINSEIAEIEQLMKTDRNGYFSNPAKQARYQELVTARDRVAKRSAA